MGLISFLGGVATAAGRAVGLIAPAATGAVTTGARTAIQLAGAAVRNPFAQSLAGGAAGVALAGGFGGGAPAAPGVGSQLQTAVAGGGQMTALAGGRFMVTAPNGDVQIFNRTGMAVRPQLIIPAGQRLPGGSIVVSTRQGGALIGITRRRRRRAFGAEIRKVRSTIQGCRAVLAAAEKPKRRSSHG